jgi:hypothetical protein
MATDAIVLLEQLYCLTLINTEARTEPYIWPALIRIDDNTLNTPELVAMDTPLLQFARVVIKDSMQAGETAGIPSTVGILRARFDEPPLPKSVIIAEIKRIRTEELAPAVAALQEARAALKACRDQLTTHIPPNTGGVLTQG